MSNVDINVDRRTDGRKDGRTENRTPISHPATSRCDNKSAWELIAANLRALFSQTSKFSIGTEYLSLLDISSCEASASRWGIFSVRKY